MYYAFHILLVFLTTAALFGCGSRGSNPNPSVHVVSKASRDTVKVMTEVSKLAGKQTLVFQPPSDQLNFTIYVTITQGQLRMGRPNGDSLIWLPNGIVKWFSGGKAVDYRQNNLPGGGLTLRQVDPTLSLTNLERLDGKPLNFPSEYFIALQKDAQNQIVLEVEPSSDFQGEWTIKRFYPK